MPIGRYIHTIEAHTCSKKKKIINNDLSTFSRRMIVYCFIQLVSKGPFNRRTRFHVKFASCAAVTCSPLPLRIGPHRSPRQSQPVLFPAAVLFTRTDFRIIFLSLSHAVVLSLNGPNTEKNSNNTNIIFTIRAKVFVKKIFTVNSLQTTYILLTATKRVHALAINDITYVSLGQLYFYCFLQF